VREVWRRIEAWLQRRSLDRDLEEELRFHLDMKERETGNRAAATRALGSALLVRERARDAWGWRCVDEVLWDIRYAVRQFRQNPGFTMAVITMLALGIGSNAAVFTVTNAVVFKGFRLIDRNDRILYIHSEKNGQWAGVSYPDFQDWRTQARSFEGMGTAGDLRIVLNDRNGFPQPSIATRITPNAFRLLGQKPILGRDFAAADDRPGAALVAILNYGFWERQYGKDPTIVGQTLQIKDAPSITVIGVMPEGFSFPQDQDLWVPLVSTSDLQRRAGPAGSPFYRVDDIERRDARNLWFAFGRLADGVTRESARAELEVIGQRLANAYPQTNQGQIPQLQDFTEFFIGPNATVIYGALWGAVGLVLLIACANVANLLVARAVGRSREISVRMALGAGRWRIVRQLLIESLMLSTMGGLCGAVIVRWGVRTYELATNRPVGEWNRNLLDFTLDHRVLAYLVGISMGTGLLFGLAPALRFSRLDLQTVLKDGGGGPTTGRRARASGLVVIGEVALTMVLLAGAGLMIRSFLHLYAADVGADLAHTRTMLLHLPEARYPSPETRISFFERLRTRLEAIPGVESASIGTPPAGGRPGRRPYELAGSEAVDEKSRPTIPVVTIGPDYFRTQGTPVLSGREFNRSDQASGVPAIVNERFARQHWASDHAVGQRLRLFDGATPQSWLTVVGVVSNIVYDPSRQEVAPVVYVPYGQTSAEDMWVLIRTPLPASGLATTFRREISALDPDVLIWLGPYNLTDRLSMGFYGSIRNQTVLLLIFAVTALMLASMGVYAVSAHAVGQRTHEIGVRIAVGATAGDILALIVSQGMLPVAIGLAIGLAGAVAVTPVLKSLLVGVAPTDSVTLFIASATVMGSAMLGCWIPARRALRIDPVVALRHE
jgi:putative ABC transport system permease protein